MNKEGASRTEYNDAPSPFNGLATKSSPPNLLLGLGYRPLVSSWQDTLARHAHLRILQPEAFDTILAHYDRYYLN